VRDADAGYADGLDLPNVRGMRTLAAAFTACLLLLGAGPASAERTTRTVGRVHFTLDLPAEFRSVVCKNQSPGVDMCGFITEARADGSRGLIQVSIVDFKTIGEAAPPTLEQFSSVMVRGIERRRRGDWKQTESDTTIGMVAVRRTEWMASAEVEPGGGVKPGPARMRGIHYAGISRGIGFALHTQDFETHADPALARAEKSLLTFTLSPTR
jgi:hypothetical protein